MQQSIEREQVVEQSLAPSITDANFQTQVMRYSTWLREQAERDPRENLRETNEYAARASRIVEVGNRQIQTFAPFRYKYSALRTITTKQGVALSVLGLAFIMGLLWNWQQTLMVTLAMISIAYLAHLVLDFSLALSTIRRPAEENIDDGVIDALKDAAWPPYTILCPLYREAQVVPQFVNAMKALDYPVEQLQILFLTEEDDNETRTAIRAMRLPSHFKIVTVPAGSPRTKPRACNYGLMEATGKYVVIYDAEDIPDPLQLKKAVLTFANHGPDLACVQAKLNFYNPDQNLLTRWFTAEYSLWFDLILPGLQRAKLVIPLGGTSNHFPTQTLRALGGWDAFNVTEDCDLGLRLAWFRLETVVLNSTTYEEANSRLKNWIRQRSRWIKGYMQTYLVHMREPLHYVRKGRFRELFSLQLVIGGKTGVLFINPLMWLLLLSYCLFHAVAGETYSALFPTPILYISLICLIAGNFFYGYIYLLGCARRRQYGLVKWMLLIPLYWIMASIAACMALYELILKPHYWQKTQHGLHLQNTTALPETIEPVELAEQEMPLDDLVQLAHAMVADSEKDSESDMLSIAPPIQKYDRLSAVPVASVEDTLYVMIEPRKAALLPSERAALQRAGHAKTRDPWLIVTLLLACLTSIAACCYFFQQQQAFPFTDALLHLKTARAMLAGASPFALTRLDGSLPLPTFLTLPFVWSDYLWHTGLAGSIPSMLCYVASAVYVFLFARRLTHNSLVSFVGSLVFISNPTILYLQSAPLSNLIGIATMTIASYYLLAWTQENRLVHLVLAAASTFTATLATYNGWILFAVMLILVVLISRLKHQSRDEIQSNTLIFALFGGLGIGLWLFWNWRVFDNPLSFLNSLTTFAASSNQQAQPDSTNLWAAVNAYGLLLLATLGPVPCALATLGLGRFIVRLRSTPVILTGLVLVVPFACYMIAVAMGQVALSLPLTLLPETPQQLLSVSFGAQMVVPAAIFIAALIGGWSLKGTVRGRAIERVISVGCVVLIIAQVALLVTGVMPLVHIPA